MTKESDTSVKESVNPQAGLIVEATTRMPGLRAMVFKGTPKEVIAEMDRIIEEYGADATVDAVIIGEAQKALRTSTDQHRVAVIPSVMQKKRDAARAAAVVANITEKTGMGPETFRAKK